MQHDRGLSDGDGGAVARRHVEDELSGAQPGGAGHVLYDDVRMARQVSGKIGCDKSGAEIEAAALARADQQVDGLVAVELARRLCGSSRNRGHKQRCGGGDRMSSVHSILFLSEIRPRAQSNRWSLTGLSTIAERCSATDNFVAVEFQARPAAPDWGVVNPSGY